VRVIVRAATGEYVPKYILHEEGAYASEGVMRKRRGDERRDERERRGDERERRGDEREIEVEMREIRGNE
jgi:hypothetical protein